MMQNLSQKQLQSLAITPKFLTEYLPKWLHESTVHLKGGEIILNTDEI